MCIYPELILKAKAGVEKCVFVGGRGGRVGSSTIFMYISVIYSFICALMCVWKVVLVHNRICPEHWAVMAFGDPGNNTLNCFYHTCHSCLVVVALCSHARILWEGWMIHSSQRFLFHYILFHFFKWKSAIALQFHFFRPGSIHSGSMS